MDIQIDKVKKLHGTIILPGDKSISHRSLMFAAAANGISEITGLSSSKDVQSTAQCLQQLGVRIWSKDQKTLVEGKGIYGFSKPKNILDAGNSGTTIRLLSGMLVGQKFESVITGDNSLKSRPMKRIIEPLRTMGANIEGESSGFAPLRIKPGNLFAIHHQLKIASAQVKSCLLLAGMFAPGTTIVSEPSPSRDHTEKLLAYLGAEIQEGNSMVKIAGHPNLTARPIVVPGDISSAAFFLVAALLIPDSHLVIKDIGLNPTRTGVLDVLTEMGAPISIKNQRIQNNEKSGDIVISHGRLRSTDIQGVLIPRIIDEIPVLAVAATQAAGRTIIRDANELRVKESDRIKSAVENLQAMGAAITELEDGMVIEGDQQLRGAAINSYNDHRIAMAFGVAGLIAQGKTLIHQAECTEISHPQFFEQLRNLSND